MENKDTIPKALRDKFVATFYENYSAFKKHNDPAELVRTASSGRSKKLATDD
jgi:hypothetical protein